MLSSPGVSLFALVATLFTHGGAVPLEDTTGGDVHRILQDVNLQPFDGGLRACAATEAMFELNCDANPSMRAADLLYDFASSDECSQHSPYMDIYTADEARQILATGSRSAGDQLEVSYTYPADSTTDGTIVGRVRVVVGWYESTGEESQHSGPRFTFDAQCTLRAGEVEQQIISEIPDVTLDSEEGEGTIPVSMTQFVNRRDSATGEETNFYGLLQDERDRPGFEVSFALPADASLDINVRNIRAVFGDGRHKTFLIDGASASADLLGLQYSDINRSAYFVLEPQLEAHLDNRPTWLAVDVLITKGRPDSRLGIGPGQANPTSAEWAQNVGLNLDDDSGRRRAQADDSSRLAASQVGATGLEVSLSGSYRLSAPPAKSVQPRASSASAAALSATLMSVTAGLALVV